MLSNPLILPCADLHIFRAYNQIAFDAHDYKFFVSCILYGVFLQQNNSLTGIHLPLVLLRNLIIGVTICINKDCKIFRTDQYMTWAVFYILVFWINAYIVKSVIRMLSGKHVPYIFFIISINLLCSCCLMFSENCVYFILTFIHSLQEVIHLTTTSFPLFAS